MTLAQTSLLLVYASLIALAIAMIAFATVYANTRTKVLVGSATKPQSQPVRSRAVNIGYSVSWLALALLGAALVTRGLAVMRAPWGNMYEFALSGAFAGLAAFLVLSLKRNPDWLAVWVVVPVFALVGLAVTVLYTEAGPLVPALNSAWLIVHVSAAIVAFGAFTVAAGASIACLVIEWMRKRGSDAPWLATAPTESVLDRFTYRLTAFGFPIWTFAVIAGAIWAENAWGRYWGWDPKETWALISWVAYAAYLHARVTAGWRPNRTMIIGLVGYATLLFNFFGVNILIPGLHSYAGI